MNSDPGNMSACYSINTKLENAKSCKLRNFLVDQEGDLYKFGRSTFYQLLHVTDFTELDLHGFSRSIIVPVHEFHFIKCINFIK